MNNGYSADYSILTHVQVSKNYPNVETLVLRLDSTINPENTIIFYSELFCNIKSIDIKLASDFDCSKFVGNVKLANVEKIILNFPLDFCHAGIFFQWISKLQKLQHLFIGFDKYSKTDTNQSDSVMNSLKALRPLKLKTLDLSLSNSLPIEEELEILFSKFPCLTELIFWTQEFSNLQAVISNFENLKQLRQLIIIRV